LFPILGLLSKFELGNIFWLYTILGFDKNIINTMKQHYYVTLEVGVGAIICGSK
jgi:hypothetical protein